jgi:hypothetical protein
MITVRSRIRGSVALWVWAEKAKKKATSIEREFVATIILFFSRRSARIPAGRERRRIGKSLSALTKETQNAEFVRVRTNQASVTVWIHVPISEVSCPVKKRR